MKKISSIVMTLLLVVQTLLPITAIAEVATGQENSSIKTINLQKDNQDATSFFNNDYVSIVFDWVNGPDATFEIPKELTIKEAKTGELVSNDQQVVGTYEVATNGKGSLHFTSQTLSTGKLAINAVINDQTAGLKKYNFLLNGATKLVDVNIQKEATTETTETTEVTETSEVAESEPSSNKPEESKTQESTTKPVVKPAIKAATLNVGKEIDFDILTSVILTDKNGKVIGAEDSPKQGVGDELKIDFTWEVPDEGVSDGDYYVVKLPSQLNFVSNVKVQLKADDGVVIGEFTVDKATGLAKVVFNHEAENYSNVKGTLSVNSKFSSVFENQETTQKLTFPFKEKPVTFDVEFKTEAKNSIDKSGKPNKAMNPDSINWTVVFNKSEDKLKEAVFSDELPAGLALDKASIKVVPLKMNIDGTVNPVKGEPLPASAYTVNDKTSPFTITFNQPNEFKNAYEVSYTTKIDNFNATKEFKNNVVLTNKNTASVDASASVTAKKGPHLEKSDGSYSRVDNKQKISWNVKYNYDEAKVSKGTVLTDTLTIPSGITVGFDKDSLIVKVVDTTSGEAVVTSKKLLEGTDYKVIPENGSFKLEWLRDLNEAVFIEYETSVSGKDGILDQDGKISNNISDGKESSGKDGNYSQGMLNKYNLRGNSDFNKKTTRWSIVVNPNKYTLKDVVIKDTELISKGLELLPETIEVKQNGVLVDINTVTQSVSKDKDGFTLVFNPEIKDTYTIEFVTKYTTTPIQGKYDNNANMTWKYNDNTKGSKDAAATFTPDRNSLDAGFKSGSYNPVTKKISWRVGINYNNHTLEKAVLSDPILQDQKIDEKSVKVYYGNTDENENNSQKGAEVPAGDFSVTTNRKDSDGNPILDVTFLTAINKYYIVEFDTYVGDEFIQANYKNTAQLLDNGKDTLGKLTAEVSVVNGGKVATKNGTQEDEIISWTVNINDSQSKIEKAKLIDTPTNNQILLRDTFELYGTKVSANGQVNPDFSNKLILDKDYEVKFEKNEDTGQESFVLSFLNTITEPYFLKYQSYIVAGDKAKVSNTISFEGENSKLIKDSVSKEIVVQFSNGNGSGSGETGSLTVKKVDAATKKLLAGATFALVAKVKNVEKEIDRKTTDESGTVTFSRLLYKDYTLKEVNAPIGYVAAPDSIQKVSATKNKETIVVENNKKIHDVKLIKKDSVSHKELAGAIFKLQKKVGEDYVDVDGQTNLTTDSAGEIKLSNLPVGAYRFVETQAPAGYKILTPTTDFTIDENQIAVKTLEVKNELILGNISLFKVDGTDQSFIPGATFIVVDDQGNQVGEPKTTDKDGKIHFEKLKPGNYSVVETQAAPNYRLPAKESRSSKVINVPLGTEGRVGEATHQVANELIPRDIELVKTDGTTKEFLAGAKFNLLSTAGKTVQTVVTDANGKLVFKDVRPGNYQVVEVEAPAGYDADTTVHEVTVPVSATENPAPVTLAITNQITLGSINLEKIDRETKEVLGGAEFTITAVQGDLSDKAFIKYTTTATTAVEGPNKGKLTFSGLRPGNYEIQETKAPENYHLDSTVHKVTVDRSQKTIPVITAGNDMILRDIELVKTDGTTKEFLAGAKFELLSTAGKTVQTVVTDADGKLVFKDVRPGNYKVVEVEAPAGYDADATVHEVTVAVSATENPAPVTLDITNQITLGSINLEKFDRETKEVLGGAEFTITAVKGDLSDKAFIPYTTTATTAVEGPNKGKLTFSGLRPGNYEIQETKAPENYHLDSTVHKVTVDRSQKTIPVITAGNDMILRDIELVKTDGTTKEFLAGAKFELLSTAGKTVQTAVTDANGKLVFKDVRPGNYKVVEVEAPADYDADATVHEVTVLVSATENPAPVTLNITNQITLGSINLEKVDRETREILGGAEFTITAVQGDLSDQAFIPYTTTETTAVEGPNKGKLTFSGLRPGDYEIQETKAPEHYHLDSTIHKVTVDRSQKTVPVITAEDDIILGSVKVIKKDRVTGKLLPGAKYRIQKAVEAETNELFTNPINVNRVTLDEQLTDESGTIEFKNLRPGKYEVVETASPNHYDIDPTVNEVEVVLSQPEVLELAVTDPIVTGSIKIEKIDSLTKEVLSGAEFSIKSVQNEMSDEDFVSFEANGVTDEAGTLTFTDLRPGDYEIQETKAPKDYELTTDVFKETVDASGEAKEIAVKTVVVENQIKLGSVEITKVDAETKALLAGAEFELKDSEGKLVKEGTTDENGHLAFNDLRPGAYTLVEAKSPNGYRVNDKELSVTIERSQAESLKVTVENTFDVGSVILTKVDSKNKNKVLEKAVFSLYDAAGKVVKENLTTDQAGLIKVEKLIPGKYYFVETKAPNGYSLSTAKIAFEIEANSKEAVQVTATNTAKPKENKPSTNKPTTNKPGSLPKTGEQNNQVLAIIGLMIVVILSVTLIFFNKKKVS